MRNYVSSATGQIAVSCSPKNTTWASLPGLERFEATGIDEELGDM